MASGTVAEKRRGWLSRRRLAVVGLVVGLSAFVAFSLYPRRDLRLPLIAELRTPEPRPQFFVPWPLAFSADGGTILATIPGNGIALWDLSKRSIRDELMTGPRSIYDAVFSPDSRCIAIASFAPRGGPGLPTVKVIDTTTGAEQISFDLDRQLLPVIRFTRDGSTFETITPENAKGTAPADAWRIRSWDVATWKPLPDRLIHVPSAARNAECFSPDGRTLVIGDLSKPGVTIWDVATEKPIAELRNQSDPAATPSAIQYSADGKVLALGWSEGSVEIWDLTTPTPTYRRTLRGHRQSYVSRHLVFAGDSNFLVSEGSPQGSKPMSLILNQVFRWFTSRGKSRDVPQDLVVWNWRTGTIHGRLTGEARAVVSADGKRLATCNEDRLIRVWDLTGK
jgi:WD40 repeat protein